jgi:catechol 2,3-dioxygenase-like lactoylglutathione lyase family enzyme
MPGKKFLGALSILVDDYDKALHYYCDVLGFHLLEDIPLDDKRWVVVSPDPDAQTQIVLARASTEQQEATIGRQAGDRVWLFLHVADFDAEYQRMSAAGVRFLELPRTEVYGKVAVFADCYGNKWDLIQRY